MIEYLSESVLSGFALCSIFLILLPKAMYKSNDSLDRAACYLVCFAGIVMVISMLLDAYENNYMAEQYLFRLLMTTGMLLVPTQILWFKKIRTARWIRLLTGLLLIIYAYFPQVILLVVSAHRDYLPSSFSVAFPTLVCELLIRLIVFIALLASFYLLRFRLFPNPIR